MGYGRREGRGEVRARAKPSQLTETRPAAATRLREAESQLRREAETRLRCEAGPPAADASRALLGRGPGQGSGGARKEVRELD